MLLTSSAQPWGEWTILYVCTNGVFLNKKKTCESNLLFPQLHSRQFILHQDLNLFISMLLRNTWIYPCAIFLQVICFPNSSFLIECTSGIFTVVTFAMVVLRIIIIYSYLTQRHKAPRSLWLSLKRKLPSFPYFPNNHSTSLWPIWP